MTTQLLKISGAGKRFGGLQALSDVTLSIQGGQIYGLIGPNGAGKTTLFNVITGLYQPDGGEFELNGHSYSPSSPHEVARALATDPLLLALDEPAAGMNATEKESLRVLLLAIREQGTTILLIEHDVKLVMGLCDRLTVLDYGKVIAEGTPAEVQKHPAVIAAYLGGEAA